MVMDPTLPRIKVRDLLMQAFLTGWERSDKSTSQDEYLQSSNYLQSLLLTDTSSTGLFLPLCGIIRTNMASPNTGTCYTDSRAGCIFHLIDTMEKEK
jgi:hypothetical protein